MISRLKRCAQLTLLFCFPLVNPDDARFIRRARSQLLDAPCFLFVLTLPFP